MAPLQPLEGDSSKPPVQRRKSSRKAGQGARAPPQAAPDGRRQRRPQRSRSGGDEIRAASPRRAREGHHQHPLAKTAPAPRRERQDHTVKVELSHKSRPFVTFRTVLLFVCGGFAVIFLVLFWSSRSAPAVTRLDPRTWVETCAGSLDVRRLSGSPLGTQAPELGVHLAQYARDLRKGSRAKAFTVLLAGSDASIRSAQKAIEVSCLCGPAS